MPDKPISAMSESATPDKIAKESESWEKAGIIDAETRKKILARYDEPYRVRAKMHRQGRLTQTVITLGAILVGIGVLLFVASNWREIPVGFKLTLILGSIASAYVCGMILEKRGYPRTGKGLLLLGALLYGAGIALIAQIYNIEAGSGTLFLLWGGGVLLSGLSIRSEEFLILSSILFTVWTYFARAGFGGFPFGRIFSDAKETIVYHPVYLLPIAILFIAAYWWKKEKLLAINLMGLLVWTGFIVGAWQTNFILIIAFYLILGIFLITLGAFQGYALLLPRNLTLPFGFFGSAFILTGSYILSFNSVLNGYHISNAIAGAKNEYWIAIGAIALLGIAGNLFLSIVSKREISLFVRGSLAGLACFAVIIFLFLFFPISAEQGVSIGYNYYARNVFNPYILLWNIALACEILGLIALGYLTSEARYVNMGILAFIILVMTRYFDVFSLYFGTQLSFIIGGALFILLGFGLERARRKILRKMEQMRDLPLASGGPQETAPAPLR